MAGLPKGQREQGLLILCVAAIVSIGAYWNFVYSKTAADIDGRQQHVASLVTMNQKAKMEVAKGNVNEIRRELAAYQQNLMLIRGLVPTGNEVPSLLEQISTAARRVGLDVATVDPQPVIEGENYDAKIQWVDAHVLPTALRASDALGLAREDAWAPGEPNGTGQCATLLATGLWNDQDCTLSLASICERE